MEFRRIENRLRLADMRIILHTRRIVPLTTTTTIAITTTILQGLRLYGFGCLWEQLRLIGSMACYEHPHL